MENRDRRGEEKVWDLEEPWLRYLKFRKAPYQLWPEMSGQGKKIGLLRRNWKVGRNILSIIASSQTRSNVYRMSTKISALCLLSTDILDNSTKLVPRLFLLRKPCWKLDGRPLVSVNYSSLLRMALPENLLRGTLCRMSSFRNVDNCRTYPPAPKLLMSHDSVVRTAEVWE